MRWLVALAILVAAVPARAGDEPWAAGVSEDRKAAAEKQLDAGNALFLEHKYGDALAAYKQGLASWDHPAIRFNIVRCLIQLDRPVEAAEQLDAALRYGAAPLGDALYAEAINYQKLLAQEIAQVDVACVQPGVSVRLDGQPLGTCPLRDARRVKPGPHQVVGTRAGFLTRSIDVLALGGKHEQISIELEPLARAAKITHRWRTWVPWAVFGAGFAVAGIGGLVELQADSDFNAYDRAVARECAPTRCPPGTPDPGLLDSARLENRIAIATIAAGAATVAAGAVLLYLNRGRTVYPDLEPRPAGAVLGVAGRF